jgi:alpha-N-arabinofuranosidase
MTQTGGPAWRQTIFHPFAQASRHAHGEVLRTKMESGTYSTATHSDLAYVLSSVLHESQTGAVTILALNRHTTDEINLEVELRGFDAARKITAATELHHRDLKAVNSAEATDEVSPKKLTDVAISNGTLSAKLKPLSWNVIVTSQT